MHHTSFDWFSIDLPLFLYESFHFVSGYEKRKSPYSWKSKTQVTSYKFKFSILPRYILGPNKAKMSQKQCAKYLKIDYFWKIHYLRNLLYISIIHIKVILERYCGQMLWKIRYFGPNWTFIYRCKMGHNFSRY